MRKKMKKQADEDTCEHVNNFALEGKLGDLIIRASAWNISNKKDQDDVLRRLPSHSRTFISHSHTGHSRCIFRRLRTPFIPRQFDT